MSSIFENSSVQRVQGLMKEIGMKGEITALADSARTAKEAADALGIEVGQVASSIVFKLDDESPLLSYHQWSPQSGHRTSCKEFRTK